MSKCVKCGNEILTGDIHWEMGLCNNCYNELYKDHKTHISLDKMWLKLAQDFRDENEKLQDKVADLEAKLAELDSELAENVRENECLKEQLAEEDKEIKELLNYDRCSHCSYGQANKEYREKCSELIEELAKVKNSCDYYMNRANDLLLKDQDKISFAVEQLEKVKEACEEMPQCDEYGDDWVLQSGLFEYIDSQIEQLTHQHEDKGE